MYAPLEGVDDGAWLLVDFLEHVVTVLTALHRIGGQLTEDELSLDGVSGLVVDNDRVPAKLRRITILQENARVELLCRFSDFLGYYLSSGGDAR